MLGLFDSGVGGLTVVKELLKRAPNASFVYLGDTARVPYGNKSSETITRYALEDAAFLIERGATAIAVACNTASAVALDALRAAYPSYPVFRRGGSGRAGDGPGDELREHQASEGRRHRHACDIGLRHL